MEKLKNSDKILELYESLTNERSVGTKEMPFVSNDFVEWFVEEMKEVVPYEFKDVDATVNAYNAGRNSVLVALLRFKMLQDKGI